MKRLQRLRSNIHLRNLTSQTEFHLSQLIQPLFGVEGIKADEEIPGLRGTLRQTPANLLKQIEKDLEAGVTHFMLFPVPQLKALSGFSHDFTVQMIRQIKDRFKGDLFLWMDTCL